MSATQWSGRAAAAIMLLLLSASGTAAQKDYYNTDKNRPVRIEDAYTTERYALEIKVAPLRLERERGGVYHWGFDPELALGILPRTSIEIGLPISFIDAGGEAARSGVAGFDVALFHNLNTETRTLPAFGLRADVSFPVGSLSGDDVQPALTAIATRTFTWLRLHANAQYSFGPAPKEPVAGDVESSGAAHEASRWLAGIAADRTFPLRAMLLIGDVYALQPLHDGEAVEWHAGAGVRYQVNPYLALDAGLGRRLTGDPAWYVTFGSAYHMGVRALMPRLR
jgi:hypothetical protein